MSKLNTIKKTKTLNQSAKLIAIATTALTLTNCAAIGTAIKHGSLKVNSKMSESIFLDPIAESDKTIYIQVRSTLSEDFSGLKENLKQSLQRNGWTVVNNISQANDMVQINVLQMGQAKNEASAWGALSGGFGADIATGALAGLAAGYLTNSVGAGIGVGAVASGVSFLTNQLVENIYFSMVTDIQVSVKTKDGQVTQTTQSNLSQGTQSNVSQTYNQKSNWMKYRTRIVSVANKVNLDFEDAKPELQAQIAKQVSGIFGA
ncbi:complement resistance protein TraT [Cysteiniphilum marinum]|uniref:complement resistance protein TraT n=1 Tax=Cysteiniphilum marinum TaxID=2774191 RepID=UPI00193B2706|nr:complement resistance protein TraT [Cysteiniphilum marinum]